MVTYVSRAWLVDASAVVLCRPWAPGAVECNSDKASTGHALLR